MPFGKFSPAENKTIVNMRGTRVPVHTPAGYGGLFWGSVYDSNGKRIFDAQTYFMKLAENHNLEDDFEYWNVIQTAINKHCAKYVAPLIGNDYRYNYQSGFGGDEMDGLIDFWLPVEVPEMPDLQFEVDTNVYTLKWEYSGGHD